MMTAANARNSDIRAARLAGVQTLYEIDISDATVDAAVVDFMSERWTDPEIAPEQIEPKREKLVEIVRGVTERRPIIDEMIAGTLSEKHSIDRLDVLLRAILRAGAFELFTATRVPARVIITEYLEIAHDFYEESEPALVNAVLDTLAHKLRSDEFQSEPPTGTGG